MSRTTGRNCTKTRAAQAARRRAYDATANNKRYRRRVRRAMALGHTATPRAA